MTTPQPDPSVPPTPQPDPSVPPTPNPHNGRSRRLRPVHLAVSAGFVLIGAALTVAILIIAGWRYLPVNRYEVRVFFDATASAEQIEAARAGLSEGSGDAGARVRTPQESYEDLKKTYAATGEAVPETVTAESLPRMAVAEVDGRDFDCAPYTAVKGMAGVESVRIGEFDDGIATAATEC